MSDSTLKNLALAIKQHPDEIKAMLKRNGVFTPDNADLPTLNKMTLAALGSSDAFRNDMAAWTQSKASRYSNVDGGDPVMDSASTGSKWWKNVNWGQLAESAADTTTAWLNYRTAQQQSTALNTMNDAQGGSSGQNDGVPTPTESGGLGATKILLIVALVGVVGGTIWYFTKKK